MDGITKGHQNQTNSQQNEAKDEQHQSRKKSRRKWWKMSRNEKEEKTQGDEKRNSTLSDTPMSLDKGNCEILDVNLVNGRRSVKSTSESMDFSLKFSVNKKPSLDPLDLNHVKKQEKKKKRKDKKMAANESSDIYKKSGKPKSASIQSPRSQNPFHRSEGPLETSASPTDSEFWGFSNSRSPLNFNVEQTLDTSAMVDSPIAKSPTVSDDEYEAEMAYRFPFLYRRLSIQKPQNTSKFGHRDSERHVTTPKPPRQTPEDRTAENIKNSFKIESPDMVCNRGNVYIIDKDTNRSTPVFTSNQCNMKESDAQTVGKDKIVAPICQSTVKKEKNIAIISQSTRDKDKPRATISRSIVQENTDKPRATISRSIVQENTDKPRATISRSIVQENTDKPRATISRSIVQENKDKNMATDNHSSATGIKVYIAEKSMASVGHNNETEVCQHVEDRHKYTAPEAESRKGRRVQFNDDLSSDIDKLLEELDDIW